MSAMAATDPDTVRPASRAEWRAWLAANHARSTGTWVVYPKVRSQAVGPSYDDLVEEALCFGWIDGRLRPVNDDVTSLWCSPRRPGSVWAASNRARVERLTASGLMTRPGIAAVDRARTDGSWDALKPVEALEVPPDLAAALDRHLGARERYEGFPVSQRRQLLFWVYSATRPATRARRVAQAAAWTAEGLRPDRWPRGRSVE